MDILSPQSSKARRVSYSKRLPLKFSQKALWKVAVSNKMRSNKRHGAKKLSDKNSETKGRVN